MYTNKIKKLPPPPTSLSPGPSPPQLRENVLSEHSQKIQTKISINYALSKVRSQNLNSAVSVMFIEANRI